MWPDSDFALLGALMLSAFLAATLLPGGSEVAFAGLLALRPELSLVADRPGPIINFLDAWGDGNAGAVCGLFLGWHDVAH